MDIDIKEIMILVDGEDKTQEIRDIDCNTENKIVGIDYKKGKIIYQYPHSRVAVIKNPKEIKLDEHAAYINTMPVYEPELILDFGERIRIIQKKGKVISTDSKAFSLVKNGAESRSAKQILDYLKDISQYTSKDTSDISDTSVNREEQAFLNKEMEQLTFVHPESVLNCYLNRQAINLKTSDIGNIIFPFSFNLSQKAALENAMSNSISVIAGPPGTGKTQTILNIISNLAIRGKSVAVVSNNNEAVKNVIEKMTDKGYGFLTALLGNVSNQDAFFANIPVASVEEWNCEEEQEALAQKIEELNIKLKELLEIDRKKAQLLQELRAWQLEQKHFEKYRSRQGVVETLKLPLFRANQDRIISFLAETSLARELNQSGKLLHKIKLIFKYGVINHKKLQQQELSILLALQKEFYRLQVQKLENEAAILENKLKDASFDALLKEHQQYSEKLFRKCLYKSHSDLPKTYFSKINFKAKFDEFIKRFPVILSTTHSLRRSIPHNYLLDYVIIDEASQVDLITGTLAFSCCRNVIIVGDEKQLPQIVNKKIEAMLKTEQPSSEYNYFGHSILTSVISLYEDSLPRETLREHYRCHPQIIEFCNQKYYGGELISFTSPELSESPLMIYKTSEGNHMRRVTKGERKGLYNQRELDVTVGEILNNSLIIEDYKDIGFVTPYRKQANKAESLLPYDIESDTVHKYQGREKKVMVMSTVLDSTRDGNRGLSFVDDPNMVNVAVSRAIKQFILTTDHDFFLKKSEHIGDLMRYIQYNTLDKNIIESKIISVFDLLYKCYSDKLIPLKAKMDINAKWQSEEALRILLEDILSEPRYNRYSYTRGILLRNLLNNVDLLTYEELNFVNNRASLDFIVFNKQDKGCTLVVEVDGFEFHENNLEQLRRDKLKDAILTKYKVPFLRCATNGSSEREKIQRMLNA